MNTNKIDEFAIHYSNSDSNNKKEAILNDVTDIILSKVDVGKYCIYFSDRGIPLLYTNAPIDIPVLTVENYCKWYKLFLINPNGSVEIFNDFDEWIDHCPIPTNLEKYCEEHNITIHDTALEVILGRYMIEKQENILKKEKIYK